MTPRDPYKNIEQLTLQQLEVNPKQYVWTMRYFLSVWQGCENAFSSFGCLFNLLETMLWVRLRCSRVCRINHQKCVTFLPPNLSYLALKIAHYSFIALKDDCSFFFPTLESAGRLLFVENEWSLLLSLGIVLHALMEALGRGKRVADGLL